MARLRERIPMEFSDDARWARYFTNTHVTIMGALFVLTLVMCFLFSKVGLGVPAFVVCLAIDIVVMLSVMIPINDFSSLFYPAALPIATMLLRTARRKKNNVIYIKVDDEEGEEENEEA